MQPCTEDHPRESARHLEGLHGTFYGHCPATASPTKVEKEKEKVMPSSAPVKLEADLLTQRKSEFHSQGLCSLWVPPCSLRTETHLGVGKAAQRETLRKRRCHFLGSPTSTSLVCKLCLASWVAHTLQLSFLLRSQRGDS